MQGMVLAITSLLMIVIIAVFIYVALNASKSAVEYTNVQARAYSIRSKFFWLLLISGVIITTITTLDLPYAATRGDNAGVNKVMTVEGRQWFWQLSDVEIKAGDTVAFNVTAADVNHGLGVYTENNVMLGQTQAMPGYTNSLKITFDEPGTYKLMCMEYCGLAHHAMVTPIEVKAK